MHTALTFAFMAAIAIAHVLLIVETERSRGARSDGESATDNDTAAAISGATTGRLP